MTVGKLPHRSRKQKLENPWKASWRQESAKSRPENLNPFSGRFPPPPNISKTFPGRIGTYQGFSGEKTW
jgi:hypothetical protein